MNRQDLIIGEYYFNDTDMSDVVFIFNGTIHSNSVKAKYYIQIIRRSCNCYFSDNVTISCNNIRLATPEEKHWLDKCIELNKFITKEEAMKSFIPEYVKCINIIELHNSDSWTFNKIYKTVPTESVDFPIKLMIINNKGEKLNVNKWNTDINYYFSFKPSTKEEYEAQNKPKEIMQKVTTIIDKLTHTGNIDIPKGTTFEVIEEFENSYQVLKPTGYDIQGKYLFLHKCYFEPQEPEFVLSNQWCIKRDDKNWKIITDYLNNNYGRTYHQNNPNFPYVSNSRTNNNSKSTPHSNHQLITFEQFKKYVLKEETKLESLVQTELGQAEACRTCKYYNNCNKSPLISSNGACPARGGQHYAKEQESKKEVTVKLDSRVYSLDEISKVINANYEKEDALEIIKTIKSIK